MAKSKRQGRIFVDYLRNGRGSTAIASYSLRSRPGMGIAMPISWDDLKRIKSPSDFTIKNYEKALKKEDPWKGFARSRRSLRRLLP
jgi:bifunctional non-homologous end joining protein LigD